MSDTQETQYKETIPLWLAVAITVFGGSLGRVAGRVGGLFVSSVAGSLAKVSPLLADAFRGAQIA